MEIEKNVEGKRTVQTMSHSFMLALTDPSIDTSRMFNIQWYVERRLGMMGYHGEEFEGVMAYNMRAN